MFYQGKVLVKIFLASQLLTLKYQGLAPICEGANGLLKLGALHSYRCLENGYSMYKFR